MTIKMTPAPLCSDDYLATCYSYSYQLLVTKALLGQSLRPGNNKVKHKKPYSFYSNLKW